MCLSRLDSFQDLNFRLRIQTRVLQVCSLIKLSREPTKNCKFLIFKVIFQRQKYAEYFWFFSCFKILNLENNFSLMPLFEELYSLKLYQNFVCSLENLGKRYIYIKVMIHFWSALKFTLVCIWSLKFKHWKLSSRVDKTGTPPYTSNIAFIAYLQGLTLKWNF